MITTAGLPLDRLQELIESGRIGASAVPTPPRHLSRLYGRTPARHSACSVATSPHSSPPSSDLAARGESRFPKRRHLRADKTIKFAKVALPSQVNLGGGCLAKRQGSLQYANYLTTYLHSAVAAQFRRVGKGPPLLSSIGYFQVLKACVAFSTYMRSTRVKKRCSKNICNFRSR